MFRIYYVYCTFNSILHMFRDCVSCCVDKGLVSLRFGAEGAESILIFKPYRESARGGEESAVLLVFIHNLAVPCVISKTIVEAYVL